MQASERDIELAAARVDREAAAAIARIRAAMNDDRPERFVCDCGEPIPEARRRAVPHTDKCIDCATFLERPRRRA